MDDEFFDEEIDFEDEVETEGFGTIGKPVHWRRIEMLREQQWLKQQLEDYDDWQ